MKYETITKEQIEYIVKNGNIDFEVNEENTKVEEPSLEDLKEQAKELKIKGYTKMTKEELENAIKERNE